MTIATEILETEFAIEFSKIAKETVTAQIFDNTDIYLFGSEIACLRIAYKLKNYKTVVEYSSNYKSFYVGIFAYCL